MKQKLFVDETKTGGKLRLCSFHTSIYLLFKQSSSGYNTVSDATAEFSNDALQNFGRN